MAWFVNHYHCSRCKATWEDEWSCTCNDRCPRCNREIEPESSDDLTVIVSKKNGAFQIVYSPPTAEDKPAYELVLKTFATRAEAEAFATTLTLENDDANA